MPEINLTTGLTALGGSPPALVIHPFSGDKVLAGMAFSAAKAQNPAHACKWALTHVHQHPSNRQTINQQDALLCIGLSLSISFFFLLCRGIQCIALSEFSHDLERLFTPCRLRLLGQAERNSLVDRSTHNSSSKALSPEPPGWPKSNPTIKYRRLPLARTTPLVTLSACPI